MRALLIFMILLLLTWTFSPVMAQTSRFGLVELNDRYEKKFMI